MAKFSEKSDELKEIAQKFTCPEHSEAEIAGFCYTDKTFGCEECLNEKGEESEVKKVASSEEATELINDAVHRSFCTDHPSKLTSVFCTTEAAGKCQECLADGCATKDHETKDLEDLYNQNLEELTKVSEYLTEYNQTKLPTLNSTLDEFKSQETARVDKEFDSYIEMIEKLRKEAHAKIEEKVQEYTQNSGYQKEADVDTWQKSVDDAKSLDWPSFLVSFSSGELRESLEGIKRSNEKLEENFKRVVGDKQLESQTLLQISINSLVSEDLVQRADGFGEANSQLENLCNELASVKSQTKSLSSELDSFKDEIFQKTTKITNLESKNSQMFEELKTERDAKEQKIALLSKEKAKLLENAISEEVRKKMVNDIASMREQLAHTIVKDIEGFRASIMGIKIAYSVRHIHLDHAKDRVLSLCEQYGVFLKDYSWAQEEQGFRHELEKVETDFVPRFWNTYVVHLMKPYFAP